jgi:K+-transporting ATPase ATPase C chain
MKHLRAAIVMFLSLTVITGVAYPLVVTLVAQIVFPHPANGSLISRNGQTVGSEVIGQSFDDRKYFWGRPSAATPPCDPLASTGSNLGPTNPDLLKAVKERVDAIKKAHPEQTSPVPVDLVTASASGIDPHISPAAAEYQVTRVAQARGLRDVDVRRLVAKHTEGQTFGVLGEPRVNVLKLNLALDGVER